MYLIFYLALGFSSRLLSWTGKPTHQFEATPKITDYPKSELKKLEEHTKDRAKKIFA